MRRTGSFYCLNGYQAGGQKCIFKNFLCCQLCRIYDYRFCWPFESFIFVTKECLISNITKSECLFHNFNIELKNFQKESCIDVIEAKVNFADIWHQPVRLRGEREPRYKLDDWKSVTQWNHVSVWSSDCTGDMTETKVYLKVGDGRWWDLSWKNKYFQLFKAKNHTSWWSEAPKYYFNIFIKLHPKLQSTYFNDILYVII